MLNVHGLIFLHRSAHVIRTLLHDELVTLEFLSMEHKHEVLLLRSRAVQLGKSIVSRDGLRQDDLLQALLSCHAIIWIRNSLEDLLGTPRCIDIL